MVVTVDWKLGVLGLFFIKINTWSPAKMLVVFNSIMVVPWQGKTVLFDLIISFQ